MYHTSHIFDWNMYKSIRKRKGMNVTYISKKQNNKCFQLEIHWCYHKIDERLWYTEEEIRNRVMKSDKLNAKLVQLSKEKADVVVQIGN